MIFSEDKRNGRQSVKRRQLGRITLPHLQKGKEHCDKKKPTHKIMAPTRDRGPKVSSGV